MNKKGKTPNDAGVAEADVDRARRAGAVVRAGFSSKLGCASDGLALPSNPRLRLDDVGRTVRQ